MRPGKTVGGGWRAGLIVLLVLLLPSCRAKLSPFDAYDGDFWLPRDKVLVVGNVQIHGLDHRVEFLSLITSHRRISTAFPDYSRREVRKNWIPPHQSQYQYHQALKNGKNPFFFIEVEKRPLYVYQVEALWFSREKEMKYIRTFPVRLQIDFGPNARAVYIGNIHIDYDKGENDSTITVKTDLAAAQEVLEREFGSDLKLVHVAPQEVSILRPLHIR